MRNPHSPHASNWRQQLRLLALVVFHPYALAQSVDPLAAAQALAPKRADVDSVLDAGEVLHGSDEYLRWAR